MFAILHSPAAMKRAARFAMALERAGARLARPRRAPAATPQERLAQERLAQERLAQAQALVARNPAPRAWRALFWAAEQAVDAETAESALAGFEAALESARPRGVALGHLGLMTRAPLGQAALAARLIPPSPSSFSPSTAPRRVAYVLNNAPPETTNGYAMRSHGMIGGLRALGFEVAAVTRPGFPGDLSPDRDPGAAAAPETVVYDGVRYQRIAAPRKRGRPVAAYVAAAADALEARLRVLDPAAVMAASNHMTALPALIAARRLGLPFVYEVRGFWEITHAARDPRFAASAAFAAQRRLETLTARGADAVLTLNGAMRDEIIARGAAADRVLIAPNCCDAARLRPIPRDRALAARLGLPTETTGDAPGDAPVIGYVGAFADYEGLDDLAAACARLKAQGAAFRLLLVGGEGPHHAAAGPIAAQLRAIAAAGGFADWLIMPGRAPQTEIAAYYSLIDIAPFPRRPCAVCELVSPLKPLEAMAMARPLVVSDVRPLAELAADSGGAITVEKGSVAALAAGLARLMADGDLRARLGQAGRAWVAAERSWSCAAGAAAAAIALAQTRQTAQQAAAQAMAQEG